MAVGTVILTRGNSKTCVPSIMGCACISAVYEDVCGLVMTIAAKNSHGNICGICAPIMIINPEIGRDYPGTIADVAFLNGICKPG